MVIPLSGLGAGILGARLLRVLPRGVDVRWVWCAVPTAALWSASAAASPPRWLPVSLALAWLGVMLATTDFRCRRLPDALTLPAYPLLGVLLWSAGADLGRAVVGCLGLFALHLVVHLVAPSALGGGDVKLSGALGAVLGSVSWLALPVGAALASAITLVVAVWRPSGGVPHGPGLAGATWLTSMWGPW
ncbi:leader peptidase (prepilin peptidase)/N-methyltransferase [Saccharothrix tamanrassetensis]|uniref:Leader peptidase (Prepilin peptidase)/N-methyltransferase n=1 Tax=Saccharothrix tamanrassetensis TaxID=1051531 RepID=A0A841CS12_9PSEU|nr:A24 family peptidase [Saccharothrix tamanrassetensis]MBB5959124.1 leader peptidase (prepilin peptidase)/N-methyltransferase [Saccharothrix tamanrassetensis]